MHSFADSNGLTWDVAIDTEAIKAVRSRLSVDLLTLGRSPQAIAEFADDLVRVVDCLYVLCEQQAIDRGLTDQEFGRSFRADTIRAALEAFLEEWIDFFLDPPGQAVMRRLFAQTQAMREAALQNALAQISAITSGDLSTASLVSPDSILHS